MILEVRLAEALGCGVDDPQVSAVVRALDPLGWRNRRIYDQRASGVPVQVIASRHGLSRSQCHRIIRDQLILRRAG